MVDNNDNRETIERTTIVETNRGGGGGLIAVVLLIIAVLALLFLFRNDLGFGGKETTEIKVPDKIDVNIN